MNTAAVHGTHGTHGTHQSPARARFRPIMLVPGMLFWALIGTGIATGRNELLSIAVVMFLAIAVYAITRAAKRSSQRKAAQRRIWAEGEPAQARIVQLTTSGGSLNDHPYCDLELDVQQPSAPARRVRVHALISMLAIPRVQPSCEIAVKVDRDDANLVVIDPALTPYGY